MIENDVLARAAEGLQDYMVRAHWDGRSLVGPDPGIRFNARIGRFAKSYLGILPWSDNYRYLQAQAYWVFANWLMSDLTGDERHGRLASACSRYILDAQQQGGWWRYPNPEWKGRVATVEGAFGTLALLEGYRRTGEEALLDGAKRWYRHLESEVGFQDSGRFLAVNYFAGVPRGMVPNNSTLVAWVLAELAEATGDDRYSSRCRPMVDWLSHVQLESGELPYALGSGGKRQRIHFLCYQYNAFEFLDLARYHEITGDEAVPSILERLARYLSGGIRSSGAACYDCHHGLPEVPYYTVAVASALSKAAEMGLGDYAALADLAYSRALSLQRGDGGFLFYSRGNYGLLQDRRSYPRYLSMILYHLLRELQRHRGRLGPAEASRQSGLTAGESGEESGVLPGRPVLKGRSK